MKITECSMEKSMVMAGSWRFIMEISGNRFEGFFDDFGGFLTMVKECAKFFAIRNGLLRVKDAGLTRKVVPGNGRVVLPGDEVM
jgi:hypothetical protein